MSTESVIMKSFIFCNCFKDSYLDLKDYDQWIRRKHAKQMHMKLDIIILERNRLIFEMGHEQRVDEQLETERG